MCISVVGEGNGIIDETRESANDDFPAWFHFFGRGNLRAKDSCFTSFPI